LDQRLEDLSRDQLIEALRVLDGEEPARPEDDLARTVHELQVHRIELEMQNRELRDTQVALEESRGRYQDLYELAPVAYLTLDPDARILEANTSACALFRMHRATLELRSFYTLVVREHHQRLLEHLSRCRAERTRTSSELRLHLPELAPVLVQLVTTPMVSADGKPKGFRAALIDITGIKQSEERLRFLAEASERLNASFEPESTIAELVRAAVPLLADVCFVDLSNDGHVFRRVEVAFADPDKRHLRPVARELVPAPDGDSPQAQVFRSGEPILLSRASRTHLASSFVDLAERGALVRACCARSLMFVPMTARGRTLGVLTLVMAESHRRFDLDDLRFVQALAARAAMAMDNAQLYHATQASVRARDELLSMVSHDLNNPLNAIMLSATGLKQVLRDFDNPRAHNQLEVIQRGARRMERLIGDLLDVASIEAGRMAIEPAEHSVEELLSEVATSFAPQASEKHIRLHIPRAGTSVERVHVRCDRQRVLQIFANLIGNAIKFTPEGGEIAVRARVVDSDVRFAISDTGGGIAPELLPHVLEPYTQAPATARLGRGLGLYIAKSLVEAHGGKIHISSQIGIGTLLTFSLPRVPDAPSRVANEASDDRSVLIVDDEPDAREGLRHMLEDHGYQVAESANGREALDYLRELPAPPRAILLDLRMPVMGGREMLRELRKDPRLAQTPVVLLSADANITQEAESMGVTAYLSKPVRVTQLLATLAATRASSRPGEAVR
jgi:PAS domain S-box-containing protein